MKFLLDENFPTALYHRLRDAGYQVEHLVIDGPRGIPDSAIRARLKSEDDLVLLTQDTEFFDMGKNCRGKILVSRVHQSRPIGDRVDLWTSALQRLLVAESPEQVFELQDDGTLMPWKLA